LRAGFIGPISRTLLRLSCQIHATATALCARAGAAATAVGVGRAAAAATSAAPVRLHFSSQPFVPVLMSTNAVLHTVADDNQYVDKPTCSCKLCSKTCPCVCVLLSTPSANMFFCTCRAGQYAATTSSSCYCASCPNTCSTDNGFYWVPDADLCALLLSDFCAASIVQGTGKFNCLKCTTTCVSPNYLDVASCQCRFCDKKCVACVNVGSVNVGLSIPQLT
jgi:hypothetical protein